MNDHHTNWNDNVSVTDLLSLDRQRKALKTNWVNMNVMIIDDCHNNGMKT